MKEDTNGTTSEIIENAEHRIDEQELDEAIRQSRPSEAREFISDYYGRDRALLNAIYPKDTIVPRVLMAEQTPPVIAKNFVSDDQSKISHWLDQHTAKRNLYYSINDAGSFEGKAKKDDIVGMRAVHVDIDFVSGGADRQEQLPRLRECIDRSPLPPSIVVSSGNGFQCLWILDETLILGGLDDPERDKKVARCESINRALAIHFHGDRVQDISRVLRLPGSVNLPTKSKLLRGYQPRASSLVAMDKERRYCLDEFDVFDPQPIASASRSGASSMLISPSADKDEVFERFNDLKKKVPKIARRWSGDHSGLEDESRSGLDLSLVSLIKHHGDFSKEEARIVLMNFVFGKCAEQPRKYFDGMWDKVKEMPDEIAELNNTFAVVSLSGKVAILHETKDVHGRDGIEYMSRADFIHLQSNKPKVFVLGKPISLGQAWLEHPKRRQYDGVAFLPAKTTRTHFNLWRGFSFKSRKGDCSKFLDHLRENVVQGNEEHYQWILGYFAHMVQRPWEKPGIALAIYGREGTGKTIAVGTFGRLVKSHYRLVSSAHLITGKFNSHLEDCLLLHSDEAFVARDKEAESRLKDLITGETIIVERKGVDVFTLDNYTRVVLTGNNEWIVPASQEARRYAVFQISETRMQDHAYFKVIQDQLDAGGYEALLYELETFDLETIDVRKAPKTDALMVQKLASLHSLPQWWCGKLHEGKLSSSDAEWKTSNVSAEDLRSDYAKSAGDEGGMTSAQFGQQLKRWLPTGYPKRVRKAIGSIYEIPSIDACRKFFEGKIGGEIDWDSVDDPTSNEAQGEMPF